MRKTLILSGWVLTLVLAVGLIGANVYLAAVERPNEQISNWGSLAMGFIFGAFPTMVRDFLKENNSGT